jgi:hypothetical protein
MHEVGERLDPVDRHDRDALAIAPLELGVGGDIDLLERERHVGANALEDAARALAQVTPRRRVERDAALRAYG